MHFFSGARETKHHYILANPIGTINIETKAAFPKLILQCYWPGGKGPFVFTLDNKTFYTSNRFCAADAGLALRWDLLEAYERASAEAK